MSYLLAAPEFLTSAASDLAGIGSALTTANSAAAAPTTGVLAAAEDEVSAAIAAAFSAHGQGFQALGAQAAAFHAQFVQALTAAAGCQRGGRQCVGVYGQSGAVDVAGSAQLDQWALPGADGAPADRQRRQRHCGDRGKR
jgi:hypothetical protein